MPKKRLKKNRGASTNKLRIIGGEWRSRKLPFVDAPGLRPTPDRIRETLFNWLQGQVHGAVCLDLFAGSGALGLEALSRGAKDVVFVEKNTAVAKQISANLSLLKSAAGVINVEADVFLSGLGKEGLFDLIFLDPPYRKGLLETSLNMIREGNILKKDGLIYLEHESEEAFDWSCFNLEILKEAKAGQVCCYLLTQIN